MPWNFWKCKSANRRPLLTAPANATQIVIKQTRCDDKKLNPCLSCGACCAYYRITFPEEDCNHLAGGYVPAELTAVSAKNRRLMLGTEDRNPRCIALEGCLGFQVKCTIYQSRPSTCRVFQRSWSQGAGNELCDRARLAYGLQPFSKY
jgi:Fe-S-cluster containining protein